jgi:hypothetical protein
MWFVRVSPNYNSSSTYLGCTTRRLELPSLRYDNFFSDATVAMLPDPTKVRPVIRTEMNVKAFDVGQLISALVVAVSL